MRIMITGNMGYVGSVLVRHLRHRFPHAELIGYDTGLFASCPPTTRTASDTALSRQILGDVREMSPDLFAGVDAVVHLAGVSNDPIGSRFETVTDEINHGASVRCALLAREAGIKCFIFASSCSVYGTGSCDPRQEQHDVNPLTAYARSKLATEVALGTSDLGGMVVTCLRFSTACGLSDRLRLDLVLNDFVASAVLSNEIKVLSDGTPWRPLIDVGDMALAVEWALGRSPDQGGHFLSINVGSNRWNYRVSELAAAVSTELGGVSVAMGSAAVSDRRSYRVDFSLYEKLAPAHQPVSTLSDTIQRLRTGVLDLIASDRTFDRNAHIRLTALERLIEQGFLGSDLRWRSRLAT